MAAFPCAAPRLAGGPGLLRRRHFRCRLGGAFRRLLRQLHEDLVALDHAQLETGPFLDGARPVFQVADFGLQGRVARAQAFVGLALLRHLALQIPDLEPPALTQPQRVLDQA